MSLMALTLSVGFVVDDAIVMLENIVRHMEQGKQPMEAAFNGAREIGFTILSMTISLAAVFIPVLFMSGFSAGLLHEFAVTIGVAILVSGFVSLFDTHALQPLSASAPRGSQQVLQRIGTLLRWDAEVYDRTLRAVLRHRGTMLVSALILVATGFLFAVIPWASFRLRIRAWFSASRKRLRTCPSRDGQTSAADRRYRQAGSQRRFIHVGRSGGGTEWDRQYGSCVHAPQARSERKLSADEVIQEFRPKLADCPGDERLPAESTDDSHRRAVQQEPLPVHAAGSGYARSSTRRRPARRTNAAVAGLQDVTKRSSGDEPAGHRRHRSRQGPVAGLDCRPDRECALHGIWPRQVSTIYTPTNQYWVIMELNPGTSGTRRLSLCSIFVREGKLVPLNAVAKFNRDWAR